VGYHDQGLQSLDPNTTVVRAVWPEDDRDWLEGDVRKLLARFGLTGELVFHTVGKLSGGEKAKAALARLCATSANLLVMDEPTNHLDIWSREALERSINEFEGTVLVVSHDRYFLNQVADRLVVLSGGYTRVIQGDYETYLHLVKEKERGEKSPAKPATTSAAADSRSRPSPVPAPDAARARRKFAYRKAVDIEREIGELEGDVRGLEDLLGQPATWRDPVKAVGLQDRHVELKARLETLYEHWETALEADW
jgi:ATP-binding cassette subfamily F protein 3